MTGAVSSTHHGRRIEPVPPGAIPVIEADRISKGFGATTALVDVSLKAYAGRILALLGDNGASKSTLIKILSGVFPPDRGELRFNGKPVVFDSPARARAHGIATVFQDLAVCELLSVTRNIVLGREPQKGFGPLKWLDMKRAEDMARSALHGLGVRWERGLDERGANISGGERQSLAIARAMYFGSSVLILDEPTSALDVRAEVAFFERFVELTRGVTSVLISHRFSSVRRADHIVVVDGGRVTEQGSHTELMAADGHYARLFALQAERFARGLDAEGDTLAEFEDPDALVDLEVTE